MFTLNGPLKIAQGQVRGESNNGQPTQTGTIEIDGFTPGTSAQIVITGWSFEFMYGDHNILNMGMWLQQAVLGDWRWAQEVTVGNNGDIKARYHCFTGSENQDNPFKVLINYAVIGE